MGPTAGAQRWAAPALVLAALWVAVPGAHAAVVAADEVADAEGPRLAAAVGETVYTPSHAAANVPAHSPDAAGSASALKALPARVVVRTRVVRARAPCA